MNEERIYQELKCLNTTQNKLNVSQARGEEQLKSINSQFKILNGSVKRHTKKIWWIEKIIWIAFGAFGAIQFYLNYLI